MLRASPGLPCGLGRGDAGEGLQKVPAKVQQNRSTVKAVQ